jgi:NitT/TauT family transport system substrate-binding protein
MERVDGGGPARAILESAVLARRRGRESTTGGTPVITRELSLRVAIVSLAALVLAACGGQAAPGAARPAPSAAPAGSAGGAPAAPAPSSAPAAKPEASAPSAAPTGAAAYRPTPLNPPVTLKVGTVNSTSDGGIFIAMEKGYFAAEGITIEPENFQTAAQMIAPLGAGQLDVATGAIAAGIFNAAAREVPLRIVADKGSTPSPAWDFNALMVRKDLLDSGQVKDYADLKGLTITTTAKGNSTEVDVAKALEKGGLTLADINYVNMSFTDMISAFANRAIDAGIVIEPFISRIESQGTALRWKGTTEFYGNQQVAVIMYGPAFMTERQDVARRWMIAYLRGVRDYNDAFGPKRQGRDEVVQILIKHTAIKDPHDYEQMRPAGLDPDGRLELASIQQDLDYYERSGLVPTHIDLSRVIDTSFQEYALQTLGPYQR